ncbi:MAG TPA: nicotinate-nucleotide adenylyltransferase [Gemmatimonadales bacterium]|nr:nicotinate-nucleotide adenylyltransferase [Gemmatimonadales bacterium]
MIGLFGGSFDPIHHGHLLVAQAVREALALDEVRFVVARQQPFKVGLSATDPELRARMVAAAVEGEAAFRLERVELTRPGPSYTIDTLRALHQQEPGRRWALLLGADSARDLPQWREAGELYRLADLVVFARAGVEAPELPWPVKRVTVPAIEISATQIRRRAAAGQSLRYWVPDPVAEVIRAEGLYLKDA